MNVIGAEFLGKPLRLGIDYPNQFSFELLGKCRLKGATVLDVGCGNDPGLGRFVVSQGAMFMFTDVVRTRVKELAARLLAFELDYEGFWADATETLDLPDAEIDFVHERFMLMHFSADDQRRAIAEILRVTKKRALFLEFDYRTFKSTDYPDQFAAFMRPFDEMMGFYQVDRQLGENLIKVVEGVSVGLSRQKETYCWPEGQYTDFLLEICDNFAVGATQHPGTNHLASEFRAVRHELERKPITFTPPTITAVTVYKS